MTPVLNYNEINKIIRNELLIQSQLPSTRVLNALSIRGDYLDKLVSDTSSEYESLTVDDSILLFELESRINESDISFTDENENIVYDTSWSVRITMYGSNTLTLARQIVARFRSEIVRNSLQEKGVYIEEVSSVTTLNEYKNETMWLRNDFTINISCETIVAPITSYSQIQDIDVIKILK